MVFWAVVSYEINRVIEWSREQAQRMLDTVVADEPDWRWIMKWSQSCSRRGCLN
jgi:hypothetical protein